MEIHRATYARPSHSDAELVSKILHFKRLLRRVGKRYGHTRHRPRVRLAPQRAQAAGVSVDRREAWLTEVRNIKLVD